MDSSRRAVESYWRSRMIDSATSDEDKVTPVYKLEEICELLRSSSVTIVKEVSEFVLKRLDHKSPIVKQKTLRLIKYAVVKSGVEFRREMQRHSVAVRNLSHYKGHVDPLKGDALNKAVRDTAQEAISAIFSAESSKPSQSDDLKRRIQGFGNRSYEVPSDNKKSFLSEVVGIGSASIKQGLTGFTQSPSLVRSDTGSYKSPNLRRSLTTEMEGQEKSDTVSTIQQHIGSSSSSINAIRASSTNDADLGESLNLNSKDKSHEERLLDTIVTSGGIRLQPTRETIQIFLAEAAKLDALALSNALKSRLKSPSWQVRMKAVCVLEAILRQKDYEQLLSVASFFRENNDCLIKCVDSPQASLREKANKVVHLLGDHQNNTANNVYTPSKVPDLIDTTDTQNCSNGQNTSSSVASSDHHLINDLLGDAWDDCPASVSLKVDDDPFSDVSFHTSQNGETVDDPFSGLTIREEPEDADLFGSNTIKEAQTAAFPLGFMQYNTNHGVILHPPVPSLAAGNSNSSPLPDIFHLSGLGSTARAMVSTTTTSKEEINAFNFISDHISASRDPKKRMS